MPYQDPLKGRLSVESGVYSVTTVTFARKPFFCDFRCARIVVNNLRAIHDQELVNSLCWVVMPDHFHWLFELTSGAELARVIKQVKGISSKAINSYLGKSGAVWQRGYYDHALRREQDMQSVARYIVANPLRAGLVKSLREYPHWDAIWL